MCFEPGFVDPLVNIQRRGKKAEGAVGSGNSDVHGN